MLRASTLSCTTKFSKPKPAPPHLPEPGSGKTLPWLSNYLLLSCFVSSADGKMSTLESSAPLRSQWESHWRWRLNRLVPSAGNGQDYFSAISQLSPFVSLSFSRDRLFLTADKIPSKAVLPHRKPECEVQKGDFLYTSKVFGKEYGSKATP